MKKRILIVDNDIWVAETIAAALQDYEVTVTHNGPEALAVAVTQPGVDLLITDYLMPVMSGDELARRFRESFPQVRTLMLSAFGQYVPNEAPTVDAQLAKPFQRGTLRRMVASLVDEVPAPAGARSSVTPARSNGNAQHKGADPLA
jgi:two-component system, OmpR family, response regulator VicR